jgi:hypothetical protein
MPAMMPKMQTRGRTRGREILERAGMAGWAVNPTTPRNRKYFMRQTVKTGRSAWLGAQGYPDSFRKR